jgi:hypothetical protein
LPAAASTVGLLIMRAKNAQVEPSILTTCTSAALRGPIGVASLHPPLQCGGTRTDFNIRRREMAVLMIRAFFQ